MRVAISQMSFSIRSKSVALLLLSIFLILSGCNSADKVHDRPEDLFKEAQEYEKGERYEEAIKRFTELKNRFPYSNYATRAKLSIADCYYKQESFAEAQVSYQSFREMHPRHAQIDEVVFKIGMSYFKQLPDSIDRDLSVAKDAISHFDELLSNYKSSEFTKEARENREAALKMLAEKEAYIANFYFIRKNCSSALPRYTALADQFKDVAGNEAETLSRAVICASRLGKVDIQKKYLEILRDKYPQSSAFEDAEKELRR